MSSVRARTSCHCCSSCRFSTWNLAYNISVQWPDPSDQWKWIREGLFYLDEGLLRNPRSVQILFEKGWIYWHKINLGPSLGPKDYFRQRLLEDEELNPQGRTAYEAAAYWFNLAKLVTRLDPDNRHPFLSPGVVEGMYYRALRAQARERLEAGDVDGTLALLEKVKVELEILIRRNGVAFPHDPSFERDYREVVQEMWRLRILQEMATGS